jgi:DeoR/GlpR family transcriptional regulator of sugar metabolism
LVTTLDEARHMRNQKRPVGRGGLITAERRRHIYELTLRDGSVSVIELASLLAVAENTIRNDLDALQREVSSSVPMEELFSRKRELPAPPYANIRDQHMLEKSWISLAAAQFLPDNGSVYINAGSATYQLALSIRDRYPVEITTNSPEIAIYLACNKSMVVDLIGGRMLRESLETDGALSGDTMQRLYWDVVFYGMTALDFEHGITSVSLPIAELEAEVARHGSKVDSVIRPSSAGLPGHRSVLLDCLMPS